MIRLSIVVIIAVAAIAFAGTGAYAYNFWDISVGMDTYDGSSQLTFDDVSRTGTQCVVGGYKYTRVDGTWLGAFSAASPGEGFLASRRSDAQGLFFKASPDAARFCIITGAAQYGLPAPEVGTGARLFGPGDLKIDVGGKTFGVGMRQDGLLWAVDPDTTNPEAQIWHNGEIDDMNARDAGTVGTIELNPRWARAGHSTLASDSAMTSAFYVSGSGTAVGSATVSFEDTGIMLGGARVFAYEVTVPWSVLGLDSSNYSISASWRPDCGNDLLQASFSNNGLLATVPVPEPSVSVGVLSGLVGLLARCRRRS